MAQSVGGAHFAEHAGEHMRFARQATGEVVALVQEIALEMHAQAVVNNELRDRARQMQDNTRQTNLQLQQQTQQTKNLVKHTMELLGSLRAFKLPSPS
jgi:methyl-accepting chemotaxis protein